MRADRSGINPLAGKEKASQENRLIKKLRAVSLFKDLSTTELGQIGGMMRLKQKKAGEELLVQGQPVFAVYFIKEGLVDILQPLTDPHC